MTDRDEPRSASASRRSVILGLTALVALRTQPSASLAQAPPAAAPLKPILILPVKVDEDLDKKVREAAQAADAIRTLIGLGLTAQGIPSFETSPVVIAAVETERRLALEEGKGKSKPKKSDLERDFALAVAGKAGAGWVLATELRTEKRGFGITTELTVIRAKLVESSAQRVIELGSFPLSKKGKLNLGILEGIFGSFLFSAAPLEFLQAAAALEGLARIGGKLGAINPRDPEIRKNPAYRAILTASCRLAREALEHLPPTQFPVVVLDGQEAIIRAGLSNGITVGRRLGVVESAQQKTPQQKEVSGWVAAKQVQLNFSVFEPIPGVESPPKALPTLRVGQYLVQTPLSDDEIKALVTPPEPGGK